MADIFPNRTLIGQAWASPT